MTARKSFPLYWFARCSKAERDLMKIPFEFLPKFADVGPEHEFIEMNY